MPKSASSSPTLEATLLATPSIKPRVLAILDEVVFLTFLSFVGSRWPTATFAPDRLKPLSLFVFLPFYGFEQISKPGKEWRRKGMDN